MTRTEALDLSAKLEELSISHVIECGIHERLTPAINYNVAPSSFGLETVDLKALMELADERGLHLMMQSTGLRFVTDARSNRKRPDSAA